MTARKLREILFYLDNQEMTVKQLREMLFNIDDQDAEIEVSFSMWKKAEAQNDRNS
jgi:hypothetical protein